MAWWHTRNGFKRGSALLKILMFAATAIAATGVSYAQVLDPIEEELQARLEQIAITVKAGERDKKLVDEVQAAFSQLIANGNSPSVTSVNASLAPLRMRFPDYHLTYHDSRDKCPIERTLASARSAAIRRITEALGYSTGTLNLQQVYARLRQASAIASVNGSEVSLPIIREAFASTLKSWPAPSVKTDWSSMDYLTEPLSEETLCE